jgi:hypothetical protein
MAKKPRKKPAKSKPVEAPAKAKKPVHPDMEIPFLKNVLVLIALFFLTYYLIGNVKGYKWLQERFIEGNLNKLEKYADLTDDQKYQAYFRFNHQFLTYIRDNTADTAIIFMPPDSVLDVENKKSAFYTKKRSNSVQHKTWSTYYIYPRRLVYFREKDEIPSFDQYTHVACVDGWGYEYLDYNVPKQQRARYQILPRTVEGLKEMQERNKTKSQ